MTEIIIEGKQFIFCNRCNKRTALVGKDICMACIAGSCPAKDYKEKHDEDPCVNCGFKRIYGQGDNIAECYEQDLPGIEYQAILAAYDMRRALCRADISDSYNVKTEALELINRVLGSPGVEYKIVKK